MDLQPLQVNAAIVITALVKERSAALPHTATVVSERYVHASSLHTGDGQAQSFDNGPEAAVGLGPLIHAAELNQQIGRVATIHNRD